ncbi:uncharacterized protein BXZ73DRAFT_38449 [Epithele typhae]|uniref:uncharacterized protein n=1 Tax=Epithele typhae TaxID=378194 RepID=UPI0020084BAA|nr:uncharacterized protein BXZ73DRAFT_38449 [Epithele typhae]KAH9945320.1 hypothetical protein BXZ73DRAFT_38449 [Epithele typhae]
MPPAYAPVPNPRYAPEDAQRELDDAFDSDDEGQDSSERTPLTRSLPPRSDSHYHPALDSDELPEVLSTSQTAPGGYDFERDYDYPPPGSPPGPSAFALPNDFGNSNGLVPSPSAIRAPPLQNQRPRSFWRRTVGALLPQHYVRVPTDAPGHRVVGGGTENDGVFANVAAKPSRPVTITDVDGNVHIVPEEVQKETPPTYAEAQADAVPPYWETTVHAPAGTFDPNAFMIVDDLPSGSVFTFIMTAFISYFFQFAGFVLTYLLHTTNAAKYGSRAGLGITLIQFGLVQYGNAFKNSIALAEPADPAAPTPTTLAEEIAYWNETRNVLLQAHNGSAYNTTDPFADLDLQLAISSRDWIALILMTFGWFLLLSSCVGFYRVKRWESSIRASAADDEPLSPEQRARDEQVRRNIEIAFGFGHLDDDGDDDEAPHARRPLTEAELRLTRTLQAAGLL